ncbi:MAG TPA: S1C family serine protease [Virgibacillus sp.]|nr:S1C family serine protease [Virgibacillus sp.]
MKDKRYLPIIISVIIMILGIGLIYGLYSNWKQQALTVNSSAIDKVNKTKTDELDLKAIIHNTEKNVMLIEGENDQETITGSGFLYNEMGDIITNAHVVEDADIIYVRTANAQVYPGAVIGVGDDTDIAVVRVPQLAGNSYLPIENGEKAEIGDEIIALGSPHGFQNTVTLGIISGTERNFSVEGFDYENAYQISAQITHGNSGGPLINQSTGNVVGINSVGTEDGTIGFSIPIQDVSSQIEQWSNETQNDDLEFGNPDNIAGDSDEEQLTEDASYLIDYFFENIMIRDYIGAYTLFGSEKQSGLSYTDFRETYIHTVDLEYSDLVEEEAEENRIKIKTDVTVETKSPDKEKTKKKNYTYVFTVGYENDQLRIMDINRTSDNE